MKYKIKKKTGLTVSEKIFKFLKKELAQYETNNKYSDGFVTVGCFINGREAGYTYMVQDNDFNWFTFCTYEHRNSDSIIINGDFGMLDYGRALPYISDSKWATLASFEPQEEEKCAKLLAKMIVEWGEKSQVTINHEKKTVLDLDFFKKRIELSKSLNK